MVKTILVSVLAATWLLGAAAQEQMDSGRHIYEKNCVACHRKLPVSLENLFFNYLLKYSSERRVKEALRSFMKHPTKKKALASEELITRYGLMPKSGLSDTDLRKAIDYYWETYKVFGKIK
ncbi:hypothetical protein [Hydrogenimonas sp.]